MSHHPKFQALYTSPLPILMKLAVYIRPIETCKDPKGHADLERAMLTWPYQMI